LNESYAKRRSDEAHTPSPHVRAQLFVPRGDERERFCSAMMIFWMDGLHNTTLLFFFALQREHHHRAKEENNNNTNNNETTV
jgi:hypothetical protein